MINHSAAPLINWPQRFAKRRPSSACAPMFVWSSVLLTRRLIGRSRCQRVVHTERDACSGCQKHSSLTLVGFSLNVMTTSVNIYETNWNDAAEEQHTDIVFAYFVILSPLILQRTASLWPYLGKSVVVLCTKAHDFSGITPFAFVLCDSRSNT